MSKDNSTPKARRERSYSRKGINQDFINLTPEEMAKHVMQGQQQIRTRNCAILLGFLLLGIIGAGISVYFYGNWIIDTVGAAWQVVRSVWNLEWWHAVAIITEYKISFFIMGIFVGFAIFLFVTLQLAETLVELIWDTISSPFG